MDTGISQLHCHDESDHHKQKKKREQSKVPSKTEGKVPKIYSETSISKTSSSSPGTSHISHRSGYKTKSEHDSETVTNKHYDDRDHHQQKTDDRDSHRQRTDDRYSHQQRKDDRDRQRTDDRDSHRQRTDDRDRQRTDDQDRQRKKDRNSHQQRTDDRDSHRQRINDRDSHQQRTDDRDRQRTDDRNSHRQRTDDRDRHQQRTDDQDRQRTDDRNSHRQKTDDRDSHRQRTDDRDNHRQRTDDQDSHCLGTISECQHSKSKYRYPSYIDEHCTRSSNEHYRHDDYGSAKTTRTQDPILSESVDRKDPYQIDTDVGHIQELPSCQHSQIQASYDQSQLVEDTGPDYEFNWDEHLRALNRMFFSGTDHIQRGSSEYEDFWAFLAKYQTFQRRKAAKGGQANRYHSDVRTSVSTSLHLPSTYNKQYRVNLTLPMKEICDLHNRYARDDEDLTVGRIAQFKAILHHYLDFAQKQKFNKLLKIKHDQENLPIYQHRKDIINTIHANKVVVVAGDTGCGKSTQVPQYLLEEGFTKIACTQPRRIACISLAKRVSFETLNEYGSDVAHQVRFEKTRTRSTRILFLTEGLLLRQIGSDMLLSQYSVVVIDEVHERHIHTDFLLGVMKCILLQRDDLKLVLMSATINIDMFSAYFNNCPVIKVPGRLYPIALEYKPLTIDEQGSKSERLDPAPYIRILQLINHKYADSERGDVLMFLSGMSEIMSVAEAAGALAQKTKKWIILPLHSSLSIAEQEKVFDIAPEGVRKCIISTNIAETSITIDGVRFVVDSGKVKEMSYDSKYKMQRLQEFWISGASAEQRKGRAGRTGPGVCFRLYTNSDYDEFQEYSTPEIQRVPLESLILQMIAMGLPDARKFPYLEPPSDVTIDTSITYLKQQGAITSQEVLTPIGQMLSQLPVDVLIGKMLIMASIFQLVDPVLSIAASLSVQSPFTSKSQRDAQALNNRKELESDHGDPITLLNTFDEWVRIKAQGADTRKWCRRRGLEQQRFYEMSKLKRQFQDLLQEYGLVAESGENEPAYMTREERRQKNIDRKRLRDLKQEMRHSGKKRKILKMEDQDWDVEMEGEEHKEDQDLDMDIRDLEFKLSNNLDKRQEQQNSSRSLTLRDVTLLKVILCSGLFPQVAIADDHNSFRSDSDQVFHTKNKGFVVLHPTSVFASNPDVLELREHEIQEETATKRKTRGQLSNKHQLLAFLSLLETQKPYLTGCLRVPALQTLLLFSPSIDTNADCARMVFDEWIEVCFKEPQDGESLLIAAVKLRQTWLQLLELKLQVSGVDRHSMEPDADLQQKIRRIQDILSVKLAEFLYSDVLYYIRRVLSAELKGIYLGPVTGPEDDLNDPSALGDLLYAGGEPHPHKGGTQVNSYLVYNCLVEEDSELGDYATCIQRHWTCPYCGDSFVVTIPERLQHEQCCQQSQFLSQGMESSTNDDLKAIQKEYRCAVCNQVFHLTTAEIFKHKKSCKM